MERTRHAFINELLGIVGCPAGITQRFDRALGYDAAKHTDSVQAGLTQISRGPILLRFLRIRIFDRASAFSSAMDSESLDSESLFCGGLGAARHSAWGKSTYAPEKLLGICYQRQPLREHDPDGRRHWFQRILGR